MGAIKKLPLWFWLLLVAVAAAPVVLPNVNWGKVQYGPAETVTVTGEAKSQQKSQIASFMAGVNSVNDDKEAAVKEVNEKIAAIIEMAKEFGIEEGDIKTQNMSVYQQEDYDQATRRTKKGQWRADTSMDITLKDITRASELAEVLTSSGATNVSGPNFRMDDTSQAERDLIDQAIKDAREKADMIAKSSGRRLGKVVNVSEGSGGGNQPVMFRAAMDMGGAGGAPMEPGSSTVYKNVTVSFELR